MCRRALRRPYAKIARLRIVSESSQNRVPIWGGQSRPRFWEDSIKCSQPPWDSHMTHNMKSSPSCAARHIGRTRRTHKCDLPSMFVFPIRVDVRDDGEDLPARHSRLVVGPRPGLLLGLVRDPGDRPRVDGDLDVLRRAGNLLRDVERVRHDARRFVEVPRRSESLVWRPSSSIQSLPLRQRVPQQAQEARSKPEA